MIGAHVKRDEQSGSEAEWQLRLERQLVLEHIQPAVPQQVLPVGFERA